MRYAAALAGWECVFVDAAGNAALRETVERLLKA
jgi:hypothetical protein